jgi:hypothetical protein
VKNLASLKNQSYTLASKKLILNMDDLGNFIDNIEGITLAQNWQMETILAFVLIIISLINRKHKCCF